MHRAEVILIGGSAGAFTLIFDIIKLLPPNYTQTIIVVIHRRKNHYSDIENLFNSNCNIPVHEIATVDNGRKALDVLRKKTLICYY